MTDAALPKQLGRYRIVRELGHGAMGVVYEGRDPNIGRRVAIKTARRELIAGPNAAPDALERFYREARVAGMLNHPNIITVYDAGEQDGTAFIAMEYIDGPDLGARIAKGPRLSTQEAVELVATLAEALAFAHEQGVVHRDVKPANIMLPRNGPPKLADFGIAHVLDSTLTQEGSLVGTPNYMSPEQFMGQRVDGRSDLFSLGIILYELLTAERPFTGSAFSTVMHHVIKTSPVPPQELNFAVGETLSREVMTALAKGPQDRHSDGNAFASALRAALGVRSTGTAVPTAAPHDATVRMNAGAFPVESAPPPTERRTAPGKTVLSPVLFQDQPGASSGLSQDSDSDSTIAMARRHDRDHVPVLGTALVVLIVVAAGMYFYRSPRPNLEMHPASSQQPVQRPNPQPIRHVGQPFNQPPRPQPDQQAPSAPPAAPAATPVPVPSNIVLETPKDPEESRKVTVNVYVTADSDEYLKYQQVFNEKGDTAAYIRDALAQGRIQPLRSADYSIVVSDPDKASDPAKKSEPFLTESLNEGQAPLQLPENAKNVKFAVHSGTEEIWSIELEATACQDSQAFVVWCASCMLNQANLPNSPRQ